MTENDVGEWIFNITHAWPVSVEVRRRTADATLMVAFVGYRTLALQQAAKSSIAGTTCYGHRVSAKESRDSLQGPAAIAAPPAPPAPPATPAKASVAASITRAPQAKVLTKAFGVAAVTVEPKAKVLAKASGVAAVVVEPVVKKDVGVLADPRFQAPGLLVLLCFTCLLHLTCAGFDVPCVIVNFVIRFPWQVLWKWHNLCKHLQLQVHLQLLWLQSSLLLQLHLLLESLHRQRQKQVLQLCCLRALKTAEEEG